MFENDRSGRRYVCVVTVQRVDDSNAIRIAYWTDLVARHLDGHEYCQMFTFVYRSKLHQRDYTIVTRATGRAVLIWKLDDDQWSRNVTKDLVQERWWSKLEITWCVEDFSAALRETDVFSGYRSHRKVWFTKPWTGQPTTLLFADRWTAWSIYRVSRMETDHPFDAFIEFVKHFMFNAAVWEIILIKIYLSFVWTVLCKNFVKNFRYRLIG